MFSKCEGCKLGPGGRTPFGIFWYSANRPAFFFRGIKPSCNFFFCQERSCQKLLPLCGCSEKMESLCVCVALLPVLAHLLPRNWVGLLTVGHTAPGKMPGGSGDGLSARIKSACFKGCCMGHVSPSRPCCDSIWHSWLHPQKRISSLKVHLSHTLQTPSFSYPLFVETFFLNALLLVKAS